MVQYCISPPLHYSIKIMQVMAFAKAEKRLCLFVGVWRLVLLSTLAQSLNAEFDVIPSDPNKEVVAIYEERIYRVNADAGTNQIKLSEIIVACSTSVLLTEAEVPINANNPYTKRRLFGELFNQQALEPDRAAPRSIRAEFDIWPTNQPNVSMQDLARAPLLWGRVFKAILGAERKAIKCPEGDCLSISGKYRDPRGALYDVSFTYDIRNRCLVESRAQLGQQNGTVSFTFLAASNNIPIFSTIHYEISTDGILSIIGDLRLKTVYETNRSADSFFISIPRGSVVRDYTSGTLRLLQPQSGVDSFESLRGANELKLTAEDKAPEQRNRLPSRRAVVIGLMVAALTAPLFLIGKHLLKQTQ